MRFDPERHRVGFAEEEVVLYPDALVTAEGRILFLEEGEVCFEAPPAKSSVEEALRRAILFGSSGSPGP